MLKLSGHARTRWMERFPEVDIDTELPQFRKLNAKETRNVQLGWDSTPFSKYEYALRITPKGVLLLIGVGCGVGTVITVIDYAQIKAKADLREVRKSYSRRKKRNGNFKSK